MISALAPDLEGHDATAAAIARHLVETPHGAVAIPGVGLLGMLTKESRPRRDPKTGELVAVPPTRVPVFDTPGAADARLLETSALVALGSALAERLAEDGGAVHLAHVGTFARVSGEIRFLPLPALRRRANGDAVPPMAPDALASVLARFAAEPFDVRALQELLATATAAEEPEDDVLVDLPAGLPRLLRAALARSAELGNKDAFRFLTPMHREWAWSDFAKERASSPPDVFLLSDAPARAGGPARVWALPLSDLGEADPLVTWCADHVSLASATAPRVRLSTWLRVFALETVLGPLDRPSAERVREAVSAVCPEVSPLTFPMRAMGALPDPWLQQVVLTW